MDSKLIAILIALLGAASVMFTQFDSKPELTAFDSWMTENGVKYDSMFEKSYRERVFLENLAKIELHNSSPHHTYKMGVNQFSAMTDDEFTAINLGLVVPESVVFENDQVDNFRADVDWMV